MKKIKSFGLSLTVISILGIGFTGCGTGSSSEGTASLSFPSNAVSAAPTIENGKRVKEIVAKNQQTAYSINAINTSSSQNIVLSIKQTTDLINQVDLKFYSLNATVNQTEACYDGGTMNISGSGSETGGTSLTITFNKCNQNGMVLNGKLLTNASNYNSTYGAYTNTDITYLSDTTVSASGITSIVYSGSTVKLHISNITGYFSANTMKLYLSTLEETNSIKSGQKNSVYYFDLSTSLPKMYQTSGRLYINNLASYVDYDTSYDMSQTPFVFGYSGLNSGEARYIMANGGKVKIVAESGQAKTYIDANGDGIYELSE